MPAIKTDLLVAVFGMEYDQHPNYASAVLIMGWEPHASGEWLFAQRRHRSPAIFGQKTHLYWIAGNNQQIWNPLVRNQHATDVWVNFYLFLREEKSTAAITLFLSAVERLYGIQCDFRTGIHLPPEEKTKAVLEAWQAWQACQEQAVMA